MHTVIFLLALALRSLETMSDDSFLSHFLGLL